jgi:hypothetical protein
VSARIVLSTSPNKLLLSQNFQNVIANLGLRIPLSQSPGPEKHTALARLSGLYEPVSHLDNAHRNRTGSINPLPILRKFADFKRSRKSSASSLSDLFKLEFAEAPKLARWTSSLIASSMHFFTPDNEAIFLEAEFYNRSPSPRQHRSRQTCA